MLTKEQFKKALPAKLHGSLSDELLVGINNISRDPYEAQAIRENILGFSSILNNGSYKLTDYLNAVKYVSYKMMGDTNSVAWSKTFPKRYQNLISQNADDKTISAHVAMYNKTKLVYSIFEQSLVPTHILNADVFQQAINTQAALMKDTSVSPKVRSDAANSLLTHLKRPEAQKVELDITHKEDSTIQELRDLTMSLAAQQQQLIKNGAYSPKEIAHQQIVIEGEVLDNEA